MRDARSGIPDSLQAGPTYSTNVSLLHPSMWPLLPPLLRDPLLIPECALNPAPTTTPTAPTSELQVLGVDHPPSSSVGKLQEASWSLTCVLSGLVAAYLHPLPALHPVPASLYSLWHLAHRRGNLSLSTE